MEPVAALKSIVGHLEHGGEAREGQADMVRRIDAAVKSNRHLVVQAGTGTGKSLAYLVPLVLSGRRTVIATATKALQDQLAKKDLPFVAAHLDTDFAYAVLKGRSNYLCLQRVRELQNTEQIQLGLDDVGPTVREEIRKLTSWAGVTETGDNAELDWMPTPKAWQMVSISAEECPGATRCPMGEPCFAESARRHAAAADIIVVNTHLYGMHLASGGVVLPEHEVVVFDEAHQLEDTISDTAGVSLGPGRFLALSRTLRQVLADEALVAEVAGGGTQLMNAIAPFEGRRLAHPLPDAIADALMAIRARIDRAQDALRSITSDVGDTAQRKLRAQKAATTVMADIDAAMAGAQGTVSWVEGPAHNPHLAVAPINVAPVLAAGVWEQRTAILTSATVPSGLAARVGLPPNRTDQIDVGSPFDYSTNGLLYCARHLPEPRHANFEAQMHDELEALIRAAGGRTLSLFTSWKAMDAALIAMRERLPFPILGQRDLPKTTLIQTFAASEETCLFATAGLFQGIDVPGSTLALVTIDKLPFPRPDDPLLEARRDAAGPDAFRLIDLPRAATLLAQAAGRLIRTSTDRGVVAVFDRRLSTARYAQELVNSLPPMKRTRHRSDVEAFLAAPQPS